MRIFPLILALAAFIFLPCVSDAKLYIDISFPQRSLPIAVNELSGPSGKEISDIIEEDLRFTGLFDCLDRAAFLEKPSGQFSRGNWTIIGAEAVVKGSVETLGAEIAATISLYDVFEGGESLKKQYRAGGSLLRTLAHTISFDIYRHITGQEPPFKTKIAFISPEGTLQGISLMDWDGDRLQPLGIKAPIVMSLRWSKDGGRLLYSSERRTRWGIYILDMNRMRERLVFSSDGTNIAGDFLPDGGGFLFSSSMEGSPDIYIWSFEKSDSERITGGRGIEVSPSMSPDGKRIAFVSDMGGSPQIYITDKSGYNIERLTYGSLYNTSPVWTPEGKKLVFVRRHEGKNQIFTINPDGTEPTQLTDAGNNEDPTVSPDGRYIAFTSDRGGLKGVYVMRANGEAQKRLTPSGLIAFGPRWSPK